MKKVIVTGATGFIGRNLIRRLLEENIEVYGIGRSWEKMDEFIINHCHFHMIKLDFCEYNLLDQKISDKNIDTFIHLACLGVNGASKKDYKIQLQNCVMACNAVESAVKIGCQRFVFAGSIDEYEMNILPDAVFRMPSHSKIYGISKYAAENIGKIIAYENRMDYVSALFSLTYGEYNYTNVLPNMIIRNSLRGKPVNLIKGDHYFDMLYIDEAIDALFQIADKGKNMESYYVGHEELRTFREIVISICRVLDSNIELRFGTYQDIDNPLDYSKIDRYKLYRDTGYKCEVSMEEGIRKTAEWISKMEMGDK